MNAVSEKTIHFNCPLCCQPVEAPAAASGRLISCPSCGREFNPPGPAPKISSSWLVVVGTGVVAAVLLIGLPLKNLADRHAAWVRTHEAPPQLRQRFQSEADAVLAQQCSIAIIGLRDIIKRDVRFVDADPSRWTANVTADFVNRVGGVERITLPFRFWTYHSPVDDRDHVLCDVDRLKISQAENEALMRQLGSTATVGK